MRSAPKTSRCRRRPRPCGAQFRNTRSARRRSEIQGARTMYNFQFHRPTGLRQASNMLGKLEEAKVLAGGQTLIPTMKLRLASPGNIVDLNALPELGGIELKGRSIVIGGRTRHVDVANSDIVKQHIPALAYSEKLQQHTRAPGYLAGLIGDPAGGHRGTLGGSIAKDALMSDFMAFC